MASSGETTNGKLPKILSTLGLLYLVLLGGFAWGYLSLKHKIFPHGLIQEMLGTVESLEAQSELQEAPRSAHEIEKKGSKGGVTRNRLPEGQDDLVFVTWFRGDTFVAELINRQGDVVHSWRMPHGQVDMSKAVDRAVVLLARNQTIHGAHLNAEGDVVLVNEYRGMVKLNRDSELLWQVRDANHHSVHVEPDGTVWSLNRHQLKDKQTWVPLAAAPYADDTVVSYTADGEMIDEFSITNLLADNRYGGVLYGGPAFGPRLVTPDPLHVNDIDVLTAEQAAHFPDVAAGDVMLSLRTPDTVIIADPQTREIRWSMTGPFVRQHDPQVTRDGLLLIYDNRTTHAQLGGNARYLKRGQKLGHSRVIAVDPITRAIRWAYEGTDEEPFFSSIQGKHEELANGNIMVVEPEGGRIFEVDRASGEIVWEYVNRLEPGYVGRVTEAIPFSREDLPFLDEVASKAAGAAAVESASAQ